MAVSKTVGWGFDSLLACQIKLVEDRVFKYMDNLKLSVALTLMASAIVAFYAFAEQSLLFRVIGLLTVIGISAAIAYQTALGKRAAGYVGDARTEVRKIVWPTRKETIQTTIIVMVMVVVVSIILWAFDVFLVWAVGFLTGQGG